LKAKVSINPLVLIGGILPPGGSLWDALAGSFYGKLGLPESCGRHKRLPRS